MNNLEEVIAGLHPGCPHCGKEIILYTQRNEPSRRTDLRFLHKPGGVNWAPQIRIDHSLEDEMVFHLSRGVVHDIVSSGVRRIGRQCEKVWKKPKPVSPSFEEYVASQIIPQGFPSPAAPGVTVNAPYQHGKAYYPTASFTPTPAAKPKPAITNRNIVRKILL